MLRYLLDTMMVSSQMLERPSREVGDKILQYEGRCAIPSLVWHELHFGCASLGPGKRRALLEKSLSEIEIQFPILPYDAAAAAWHAKEQARLKAVGMAPPFVDGQIAAIAHTQDLVLVTNNAKHFAPFKDVRTENWFSRK